MAKMAFAIAPAAIFPTPCGVRALVRSLLLALALALPVYTQSTFRQPSQMFLTEFKVEPLPALHADPAALKAAITDFVNNLGLSEHPLYTHANVTVAL